MMRGVHLAPLRIISGDAGNVLHALRKSWEGFEGFGEAYFSEIHQGAIKNWRRHRQAVLNLIVPTGSVRFVVHDGDAFAEHEIGRASDYARLVISPGLWFALQGIGPGTSLILSLSSLEHDPSEAETLSLADIPFRW
jgi:dTDP-4-dehydrorhamnose 3,5-epimerase